MPHKVAELIGERSLGRRGACHTLAFSPANKILDASTWDRKVLLWDVDSRKRLWQQKQHRGPCYCARISPDSKFVASCGPLRAGRKEAGAEILFWTLPTGAVIDRIELTDDLSAEAFDVECSRDGKYLACAL